MGCETKTGAPSEFTCSSRRMAPVRCWQPTWSVTINMAGKRWSARTAFNHAAGYRCSKFRITGASTTIAASCGIDGSMRGRWRWWHPFGRAGYREIAISLEFSKEAARSGKRLRPVESVTLSTVLTRLPKRESCRHVGRTRRVPGHWQPMARRFDTGLVLPTPRCHPYERKVGFTFIRVSLSKDLFRKEKQESRCPGSHQ